MPRRNPEDIDLAAIKADLEFLIERGERFRKEQVLKPLYTMIGSAAFVIAWMELFRRVRLKRIERRREHGARNCCDGVSQISRFIEMLAEAFRPATALAPWPSLRKTH